MDREFETELQSLLADGQKIEAIKRYRERFGVGLKEAKDAIDALEQEGELPRQERRDSSGIENEIVSLLEQGRTIDAIQVYREFHGGGLKEAKDAVDAIAVERRINVPKSGCLGVVLAALLVGFAFHLLA